MKKLFFFNLIFTILISTVSCNLFSQLSYTQRRPPTPYPRAASSGSLSDDDERLMSPEEKFERRIQLFIGKEVLPFFESYLETREVIDLQAPGISAEMPPLVVFDIDGTSLDPNKKSSSVPIPFYERIEGMLNLYKYLRKNGFKIAFISARLEDDPSTNIPGDILAATISNLRAVGFDSYVAVICMPKEFAIPARERLVPTWKNEMRQKLAKEYNIVATFDDQEDCLQGTNLGKTFLVPHAPQY